MNFVLLKRTLTSFPFPCVHHSKNMHFIKNLQLFLQAGDVLIIVHSVPYGNTISNLLVHINVLENLKKWLRKWNCFIFKWIARYSCFRMMIFLLIRGKVPTG